MIVSCDKCGGKFEIDTTKIKVSATFTDPLSNAVQSKLVGGEVFLGALGASTTIPPTVVNGAGTAFLASDGAWDSSTEAAYSLIPTSLLSAYPTGSYVVWIHSRDGAGNWGPLVSEPFQINKGQLVSDGFECRAGVQGAWSSVTGASGLALNSSTPIAGTQSLQVNSSSTTSRYVSQSVPASTPPGQLAVTTLSARFAFNPYLGTVLRTSGSNTASPSTTTAILSANSGTGGANRSVQIQYRRGLGSMAISQVRLVVFTTTGGTSTAGSWNNLLPAGASTLQVDWSGGSAKTITLRINGASVTTINATTTAVSPITQLNLGLSSTASSTAGSALFDSVIASRNALP